MDAPITRYNMWLRGCKAVCAEGNVLVSPLLLLTCVYPTHIKIPSLFLSRVSFAQFTLSRSSSQPPDSTDLPESRV